LRDGEYVTGRTDVPAGRQFEFEATAGGMGFREYAEPYVVNGNDRRWVDERDHMGWYKEHIRASEPACRTKPEVCPETRETNIAYCCAWTQRRESFTSTIGIQAEANISRCDPIKSRNHFITVPFSTGTLLHRHPTGINIDDLHTALW
jgi:hypothetical protein